MRVDHGRGSRTLTATLGCVEQAASVPAENCLVDDISSQKWPGINKLHSETSMMCKHDALDDVFLHRVAFAATVTVGKGYLARTTTQGAAWVDDHPADSARRALAE